MVPEIDLSVRPLRVGEAVANSRFEHHHGIQAINRAIAFWETYLGSSLWRKLSADARHFLTNSHVHFAAAHSLPHPFAVFADFGSAVLQLSNGLLAETNARLGHAIRANRDAFAESKHYFHRGKIEWASLCRMLNGIEAGRMNAVCRIALSHGIGVQNLMPILPAFRKMQCLRNKPAHIERVRQEDAGRLYGEIVRSGVARRMLAALHAAV